MTRVQGVQGRVWENEKKKVNPGRVTGLDRHCVESGFSFSLSSPNSSSLANPQQPAKALKPSQVESFRGTHRTERVRRRRIWEPFDGLAGAKIKIIALQYTKARRPVGS